MRAILVLLFPLLLSCTSQPAQQASQQAEDPGWKHLSTVSGDLAVPGKSAQQTASLVGDFNADGVNDFVIGCRKDAPSMILYLRNATGWDRLVIDSTVQPVEAGGAVHDIDGDGDLDIVMGGDSSSDQLWWWENPSPALEPETPWTRRLIKSGGGRKHHDQIFGDFDGDGRVELVFWNQGAYKMMRAAVPTDPTVEPWPLEELYSWSPDDQPEGGPQIPSWAKPNEHEGFAAADIDGDGVTDLVGGGRWFRFASGSTEVFPVDTKLHFSRSAAGQLVQGGRPEIVLVVGDGVGKIKLYHWTGTSWAGRDLLGHDVWNGHTLQVLDLDGDGNLDVFCAEMGLQEQNPDARAYAFLGDGKGGFRTEIATQDYANHESKAADLDGDGDIDILGKPYNWRTPRLDIWLNGGAAFGRCDGLPFEHIIIDQDGPLNPHTKASGDLDGDGIEDLIICSSAAGPLVWYRSPQWEMFTIAESGSWSCDAEVGDMDGDGDNDLVISEYYSKKQMEWYENPGPGLDPASGKWKLHAIGPPRAHDIELVDLDSDGDLDIISRSQSGFGTEEGDRLTLWYHGSGDSWSQQVVTCPHGEGLAVGDMNRDGLPDLTIGGRWFANPGAEGGSWAESVFAEWNMDAVVRVADMNADGRLDVLMTEAESTGDVAWFEAPENPTGGGWPKHVIGSGLEKGHSLGVADLDNDGDMDVVTAEMHQSEDPDYVLAFINQGDGAWHRQELSERGSHGIRLGDFDGDGDVDIFGANWKSVARDSLNWVEVWRNNLGTTSQLPLGSWRRHVIDREKPWRAVFIDAADMDGDGDREIITGGWLYDNPGQTGQKWTRKNIGEPLRNMAAVHDLDSDGLPDVLGTTGKGSDASAEFVWAWNKGGGKFEIRDNIPEAQGDFLQGIEVVQAGPNALAAVLSWHKADQGIQAFIIPEDPMGENWEWMKVTDVSQDEQLSVGDIDRDGDQDLLLGTIWLENHGNGSVTSHILFKTDGDPDRNRLADVNGDGRLDAVVGYEAINVPGKLAWYENPPDSRQPWTEHVVANVVGPMSMDVADIDMDGDTDIVVGEHNYKNPETARLLVYSNLDGKGGKWREQLIHTGDEHHDGARVVDIDNDGDLDIISIGWSHGRVLLYENLAM
jgi:VCBS repeat protein